MSTTINPNILIADDHAIIRNGLEMLLSSIGKKFSFFHASDKVEIFDNLKENTIDLIVLDLNFEDGNAITWIKEIKTVFPEVKIIIFSSFDESVYKNRVLSLGANAFISKLSMPEEIILAFEQTLYDNEIALTAKKSIKSKKSNKSSLLNVLSNREMEIALLMIKGVANLEISNKLNLRKSTVSTYKQRIYDKLNVSSVAGLIEIFKVNSGIS
ncbi:response regulator [Flavobacterium sp.]|jgi:DNA-binding NarL/FixJ family response regulator|uniref:response regulator transcription factor n=1 Tax=Flavobacterium sp. TaxID=239 RepID=UPI0037C17358